MMPAHAQGIAEMYSTESVSRDESITKLVFRKVDSFIYLMLPNSEWNVRVHRNAR